MAPPSGGTRDRLPFHDRLRRHMQEGQHSDGAGRDGTRDRVPRRGRHFRADGLQCVESQTGAGPLFNRTSETYLHIGGRERLEPTPQ